MINNMAKLLKKLLLPSSSRTVEAGGGLAENQHEFRKGKGTVQVIREVMEIADAATSGVIRDRILCLW